MGKLQKRNLGAPDELRSVGRGQLAIVEVGDAVVGQITFEPGWRWSLDVKPIVGTGLCEVHHVGYIVSGSLHTEMRDGSMLDVAAGDVYELPPGHDSWVVGDEPCVSLDWTGNRFYGESPHGTGERVLATILFTDIVGSTQLVAQLGDHVWRDRLSEYHALVRRVIERHRGLEIQTTGDGMLARFDSPARAVACAVDLARATPDLGFEQRAGLHTGEVEFAGDDVRGIAVHLAARVAAAANAGEVLVSAVTNGLLFGSGLTTVSRGNHSLKGMERAVELFVVEV